MVYDFGYRLRELRESKHLTQTQVAKKLDLSKTTVSGYENNIKTPSLEVLRRMAILYEVSSDYILGLEHRKMVCVDGLSDRQRALLNQLVQELNRSS